MSMFQKRHYDAIARVLDHLQLDGSPARDQELTTQVVEALAAMLEADNPLFKRTRFLAACGLVPLAVSGRLTPPANPIPLPSAVLRHP